MGDARRGRFRRWTLVLVGTALLVGLPRAWAARPVSATTRSPAEIVAAARGSRDVQFTGLATSQGDLGLPDIPRLGSVAALLGSTTRCRVWWASPATWRVARLATGGETDTLADHGRLRVWDYETNQVVQVLGDTPVRLPRADDLLPPQAVRRLLSELGPHDHLSALPPRRVAGQVADGVRIRPVGEPSTIGRADVYVERRSGLPVLVDLVPRGADHPALRSWFDELSLRRPADRAVRPPITVWARHETSVLPDLAAQIDTFARAPLPATLGALPRSRGVVGLGGTATYGTGLARVAVLPLSDQLGQEAVGAARSAGGLDLAVGASVAVLVRSPLLTLAVVRTVHHGRPWSYLVSGTVTASVMSDAVDDLVRP
jgi:hypothetical protein